jgi:predicted small metal-binding protein
MTVDEMLIKVKCPNCGFLLQRYDEKEIAEIIVQFAEIIVHHAKKSRNATVTEEDVKEKVKDAA